MNQARGGVLHLTLALYLTTYSFREEPCSLWNGNTNEARIQTHVSM